MSRQKRKAKSVFVIKTKFELAKNGSSPKSMGTLDSMAEALNLREKLGAAEQIWLM